MAWPRVVFALALAARSRAFDACIGEYSLCADGSCALVNASCGLCGAGEYACPLSATCLASIDDFASCEGLADTHFDTKVRVLRSRGSRARARSSPRTRASRTSSRA